MVTRMQAAPCLAPIKLNSIVSSGQFALQFPSLMFLKKILLMHFESLVLNQTRLETVQIAFDNK